MASFLCLSQPLQFFKLPLVLKDQVVALPQNLHEFSCSTSYLWTATDAAGHYLRPPSSQVFFATNIGVGGVQNSPLTPL